ncbi:MAG: hypothetical protein ABIJ57_01890 [Pseudomonadota bacterium]
MGLMAKDKGDGKNFDPIPQAMHHAICYSVYDLGTQYNEKWNKSQHKVILCWELPEQRIEIEKDDVKMDLPRAISRRFTLSLHPKSDLCPFLENWRGKTFTEDEKKGFDVLKLLGVNCNLQILHVKKDDKIYANVAGVFPLLRGAEKKEPENPIRYFSFEEGHVNIPEGTPDWICDMIKAANEWGGGNKVPDEKGSYDESIPAPDEDDDIPF